MYETYAADRSTVRTAATLVAEKMTVDELSIAVNALVARSNNRSGEPSHEDAEIVGTLEAYRVEIWTRQNKEK